MASAPGAVLLLVVSMDQIAAVSIVYGDFLFRGEGHCGPTTLKGLLVASGTARHGIDQIAAKVTTAAREQG